MQPAIPRVDDDGQTESADSLTERLLVLSSSDLTLSSGIRNHVFPKTYKVKYTTLFLIQWVGILGLLAILIVHRIFELVYSIAATQSTGAVLNLFWLILIDLVILPTVLLRQFPRRVIREEDSLSLVFWTRTKRIPIGDVKTVCILRSDNWWEMARFCMRMDKFYWGQATDLMQCVIFYICSNSKSERIFSNFQFFPTSNLFLLTFRKPSSEKSKD